jgi:tryptophan-rich sensory protein
MRPVSNSVACVTMSGQISGMSWHPTERQFVVVWTILVLLLMAALGMWARHSLYGVIALGFAFTVVVGAIIAHRLAFGRWIDEGF